MTRTEKQLLTYATRAGERGFTHLDAAAALELQPRTAQRLLRSLYRRGYLYAHKRTTGAERKAILVYTVVQHG